MVKNKIKRRKKFINSSDDVFNLVLLAIATLCFIIVLYPMIFIIASSFSSPSAVISGSVFLWPVGFSLKGYEMVLQNSSIWRGFANTIFLVVSCTSVYAVMGVMLAYPLSRRDFYGRQIYNVFFLIPMWFSGGLIPTYLLMNNLGLVNSLWGMVVMTGVPISGSIVIRTYFQSSIPGDLLEASKMDGITDVGYLLRVALPLSKPVMAVQITGWAVGVWNTYFSHMIYLRDDKYHTLQMVLRSILNASTIDASSFVGDTTMISQLANISEVMKYSLIVMTTLPLLLLFPYVQRHFKKGMMVGSLKG